MAQSESGRLGKFHPSVHHTKKDELVVYWYEEPDQRQPVNDDGTIILLPAVSDATLITGVRVLGFHRKYVCVPNPPEPPPSRPNFDLDNDPDRFKPYVWYDHQQDTVLIRWRAGRIIREESTDCQHPFTLLRSVASRQIVGVTLYESTRWFRWR